MNSAQVARRTTELVVRHPWLWRFLRGRLRDRFDELAPTWDTRIGPHHLTALAAALEGLPAPRHVLDLGTGTGVAAQSLARRYPEAEVVGVDLSAGMLEVAEAQLPDELRGRVRYQQADASSLPFADEAFELVVLVNMIPFFAELARVTASGGHVVVSFSRGDETPIYVEPGTLRRELGAHDFVEFAEFSAPPATALRATKR